jgi:tetratricopeptide (TPR) repeat protein
MGRVQDARNVFEEILVYNPLSFEALFENPLLMDRCGEGEAVIRRLQEALDIAGEENKVKEARNVRLIMAQMQFLQKNVEKALKSYQELSKEDPKDFGPYFCRGIIYSLLDRNEGVKEQFPSSIVRDYIINRVAHSGCLHGGNSSFYLERLYGVRFDH